jgi:osmotically inducible lipoprotein OsmB
MIASNGRFGSTPRKVLAVAAVCLLAAACESGSGGPGVGTVGGAALGAGAGRAIFGNSTSAMLIGGAVGGMAGNMTIDRQAEDRQFQQQQQSQDLAMQRQLEFERQRQQQQLDFQRQQEEQRVFNEWAAQQGR